LSTLPQPAPSALFERELDVRYYADVLWRSRVLIAAAAILGVAMGGLFAFIQTPEYRAGTMIQIDPPTPAFLSVADALGGNYLQSSDFYNTQFKVLHSVSLGEKAVDRLKLKDRPPFKDSNDVGGLFMTHVTIEPIPDSRLTTIYVTHTDPEEAALWANMLATVYVEQSVANRVESAKKAYDWLQDRLAVTQQSMRDAQDKLFKSYQRQDLFVPEGSVSAVTTSITKLNEDYIAAQSKRITLEAALKQAGEMRRTGQSLDNLPQVAVDTVVAGLNTQLATFSLELSKLKEKYKEGYPDVQKIQAQIDQIKKTKETRATQILDGLQVEYNQLLRREADLRTAIDSQKGQAASQSRKVTELETLKKEADSAKNLYEVLLQKLNETDIAASLRNNNVSVVEHAARPRSPIRPNKPRVLALGLFLGVALGIGLVIGRDYLDNTIKDPDELERYLHLDLLAAVPKYDGATVHFVTEAYQNLRTALIFSRKDEGGQVVLITGTAPQEGKTTTLINAAKLLASSGEKTIALDFDLRRANLHGRLGLTREPGLTNFFSKHEDIDSLVRATRVPNLYVLTAGFLPPNPPAILARKDVSNLLNHLRRHFDWILIDSPPLASVTDALLLARHADTTIVVVQHNKIDKRLIKRNVTLLRKVAPSLLGAVLNAVDVKAQSYYYYYYQQDSPGTGKDAGREAPRKDASRPVAAAKK